MRRLLAGAQPALQEPRTGVPDQMLAVLLPVDAEGFPVEDENAAWCVWIGKDRIREITVQVLQDRHMTLRARGADPTVRTAIEDVTVMKRRCRFPAPAFDSECAPTGIASPSPPAEPDSPS